MERLWAAARYASRGELQPAASHAEYLVRAMPDEEDGSGALAVRTFAEALLSRVGGAGTSGGNLYLDARPPGAQLRAFELLRLRTPLIPFGYAAGNRALLDAIDEPSDVTLIDVGIGRGGQARALLRNPSARRLMRSVHIVGIEPDSSSSNGAGALELAEQNVLCTAGEVGIRASFYGIPLRAEDLSAHHLRQAGLTGVIVGNAAFSLHHVPGTDDTAEGRDHVLRVLLEAGANSVVLVEPDSNHYCNDFLSRFLYAYRHYRTVSRSLHALLEPADALLVWNEFFAAEVLNVVAHDGPERTERHEESSRWVDRLRAVGWAPQSLSDLVPQAAAPPGFVVHSHGPAFCLSHGGVTVLSVIRALRQP